MGKAPSAENARLLTESLTQLFDDCGVETVFCHPFGDPGIDSSAMEPWHWAKISRGIVEELKGGLTGVLVLHGTDTMANTAAWLSLCFGRLPIPIVLTGSQLTLDYKTEDVTTNMRGAAMACCSNLRGVWVYFNWKLIPGDRAHKAHAMHPDAFTAINGQPMYFDADWALSTTSKSADERCADMSDLQWEVGQMLSLDPEEIRSRCRGVSCFFAMPGTNFVRGGRSDRNSDEKILCLIGYGAENMIPSVLDELEADALAGKKPCVIACSQAEGGIKNPAGYDLVGMSRLTKAGLGVWNQMDRSIEFVYSLCCYALAVSPDDPSPVLSRWLRECS